MKSVGQLSQVCSQIVLKCLYLTRIGRPDILWSVNKLAKAVTKWTSRTFDLIHTPHERIQTNTAQRCKLGLFQDSDFAGDLEDS